MELADKIIENFPGTVLVLDSNFYIIEASKKAKDLLSISIENQNSFYTIFNVTHTNNWKHIENFLKSLKIGQIAESNDIIFVSAEEELERFIATISAVITVDKDGVYTYILNIQNINSYREMQQKLKDSRDSFQQLLNALPNFVWSVRFYQNGQNIQEYVSQAIEKITGYEYKWFEQDNHKWKNLVYDEDLEHLENELDRLITGYQYAFQQDFRMIHHNGNIIWCHISALLEYLEGGYYQIMAVISDITEQKIIASKLAESEARYRLLSENTNDVIFSLNFANEILYLSPSMKNLTGYEPSNLIGQPFSFLLLPGTNTNYLFREIEKINLQLKENSLYTLPHPITVQIEMRTVSGEKLYVKLKIQLMADESKKVMGYRGVLTNITEHKQIEQVLLENQRITYKAAQKTPEAFVLVDKSGTILSLNNVIEKIIQMPQNELIGKNLFSYFTKERAESYKANIKKVFETMDPVSFYESHEEQSYFTFIFPIASRINGDIQKAAIIVRDITNLEKANQAAIENLSMLQLLLWV
ncbi:MAG TPA: PAS domain S-box protein [Candidatus Marinimicrobia bacterium]|nr:PAS domain S-box protein [Candidatus Neomarinimicrobiota bacterium]